MKTIDRKLLRDLVHLRSQMAAVALVVACAIAMYVTMSSTYRSLIVTQMSYYETYRYADIFAQLKRAPESIVNRIREIPGAINVQTRIVFEIVLDLPGLEEPATAHVVSIPEHRAPLLNDLYLRTGRYIEPGRRNEALISEAFASANDLEPGDSIGAILNGRWEKLQIVGVALSPEFVYLLHGASLLPDNRRFGVLWMSRDAMEAAFDMKEAFNDVVLKVAPSASEASVIEQLDQMLEPYGGLGAGGRDEQASHRFLSDEIAQDRVTGVFIPAVFLGIAAFLIHIVLTRLVGMQRAEIAVLKAFGYSNTDIGSHYLKFAMAAVLTGSAFGIPLGIYLATGLTRLYVKFFHFPVLRIELTTEVLGIAVAISGGAALLGSISAVRRAVVLPPAEAMRPEPPPLFRQGMLSRISLRGLSPSFRMILRNVSRRRWKAVLTTVGISMAIAILVVGRYSFDAIDYMAKLQFRFTQREDVTLLFQDIIGAGVRYDVQRLPGVLYSEIFRAVPVRLRFEHRSKRIVLTGLEPKGRLRLIIDQRLGRVAVPEEGVVLTTKLAEILGVRPGDLITAEVLEGSRPVRKLRVTNTVDELIGLSAYMNVNALHRMLREGASASGAYLTVDPAMAPYLYERLKRTPAVGGVGIKESMLTSFNETLAESMNISITALIVFACVIAFGMVYNGIRISLSERGHELASLRVLGFTRQEVSVILLGEQVIFLIGAIPLGFALGSGICALLVRVMDQELYRMPLVISGETYLFSLMVVVITALVSALAVLRRIWQLDLVAVLKTRE